MARCNSCNGVIAKNDSKCYVCGDSIPGRSGFSFTRWFTKSQPQTAGKPVTRMIGAEKRITEDPLRP